ncbi:hypothetical protein OQA88_1108 [Cercophora sp. LCS_1]
MGQPVAQGGNATAVIEPQAQLFTWDWGTDSEHIDSEEDPADLLCGLYQFHCLEEHTPKQVQRPVNMVKILHEAGALGPVETRYLGLIDYYTRAPQEDYELSLVMVRNLAEAYRKFDQRSPGQEPLTRRTLIKAFWLFGKLIPLRAEQRSDNLPIGLVDQWLGPIYTITEDKAPACFMHPADRGRSRKELTRLATISDVLTPGRTETVPQDLFDTEAAYGTKQERIMVLLEWRGSDIHVTEKTLVALANNPMGPRAKREVMILLFDKKPEEIIPTEEVFLSLVNNLNSTDMLDIIIE